MLRISEIYETILGESLDAGRPCVIVRLTGCHRRCDWCDTRKAWTQGRCLDGKILLATLLEQAPGLVVLSGGEPLLQAGIPWLAQELLRVGRRVSVETNGTQDIEILPPAAHVVLDMKAPSSGETEKMDFENLTRLRAGDDLKIVIADRADFDWACQLLELRPPTAGVNIFVSAAFQRLDAALLAHWLIESGLDARLQMQLHKLLWPDGGEAKPLALPPEPGSGGN